MTAGDAADHDPIARRLARSGIVLPAADLDFLQAARVALDAARTAVTTATACAWREEERPWPLTGGR